MAEYDGHRLVEGEGGEHSLELSSISGLFVLLAEVESFHGIAAVARNRFALEESIIYISFCNFYQML